MRTYLNLFASQRLASGLLALAGVAFGSVVARADVKLPAIISDHMVAQSDGAVPIWGWAEPGEDVTVTLAGQSQSAKAGADGKWSVKLDKRDRRAHIRLTLCLRKHGRLAEAVAAYDDALALGKRQAARYFYRYELPRTGPQLDLLARLDRTTLDLDPTWL